MWSKVKGKLLFCLFSMNSYIQKLRGQSETKRKAFAYTTAFILTVVIFLVWLSTFLFDFATPKIDIPAPNFDFLTSVFEVFKW